MFIHKVMLLVGLIICFPLGNLLAQEVLFDFDNAPLYASLPLDVSADGITAHLSATDAGYSIQNADVLGFTPPGFSGHIIYPNSIYLSDLLIFFDRVLTRFSIMYSPQELGCDDSATLRVTAYKQGSYVGTNTRTATNPGTWPVDTLNCSFPEGFDSVVVHYDSPPPTCQDYGVIFMADNMRIIPAAPISITEGEQNYTYKLIQNYPNPFNPVTIIKYSIPQISFVTIKIYDLLANEIAILINEEKPAGAYQLTWNAAKLPSGIYFYLIKAGEFLQTKKMILLK